jgi:preprotein translocase subunit SecG
MTSTTISLIIVFLIISFIIIFILKKRSAFKKSLELSFLKITMPKKDSDLDEKKETTKDFKEMI